MRQRDLDRLRKLAPQFKWALVRLGSRTIFPLFEAEYRGWRYQCSRALYDEYLDRKTRDRFIVDSAFRTFIVSFGLDELRPAYDAFCDTDRAAAAFDEYRVLGGMPLADVKRELHL